MKLSHSLCGHQILFRFSHKGRATQELFPIADSRNDGDHARQKRTLPGDIRRSAASLFLLTRLNDAHALSVGSPSVAEESRLSNPTIVEEKRRFGAVYLQGSKLSSGTI